MHHLPLRQTVGTTMLVLVFISASGGAALARHGDVSVPHLSGPDHRIGIGSLHWGALHPARAASPAAVGGRHHPVCCRGDAAVSLTGSASA